MVEPSIAAGFDVRSFLQYHDTTRAHVSRSPPPVPSYYLSNTRRTKNAQPCPTVQLETSSRRPPPPKLRLPQQPHGTAPTSTSGKPSSGASATAVAHPQLTAEEDKAGARVGAAAKGMRRRRGRPELFARVAVAAPGVSGRPLSLETGAKGQGGIERAKGAGQGKAHRLVGT